jgi:hypothetical protein
MTTSKDDEYMKALQKPLREDVRFGDGWTAGFDCVVRWLEGPEANAIARATPSPLDVPRALATALRTAQKG